MYQTKGKIVRREFFNMKATGIVRRIDDLGRVVYTERNQADASYS